MSELVGVVTLNCSGGTPYSGTVPSTTIDVYLSAPYSGKITQASGAWTESLLTVDDPASPVLGTNVYQGQFLEPNHLRFSGVQLNPPGSGGQRRIRIMNMRVATPDPAGSQGSSATAVTALISVSSLPISNPKFIVGFSQAGQRFQLLNAAGAPVPALSFATTGQSAFRVRFDEGFHSAFRKRNTATSLASPTATAAQDQFGHDYGTESGFYAQPLGPVNGADQAGIASQGTRLAATFSNIPAGVSLSVSVAPRPESSTTATARLVQADATGSGTYLAVAAGSDGRATLTSTGGTARAVWEVLEADAAAIESLQFDIIATYAGTVAGATGVVGAFAPFSSDGTASASLPIPRFGVFSGGASSGCASDCLTLPSALSFRYRLGDPIPAAKLLPVGSSGAPLTFRAVAISGSAALGTAPPDGSWLLITPTTVVTAASLSVSVQPGALPPGNYQAVVNITGGKFSENVFVFLQVQPNAAASSSPFTCTANAGVPPTVRANGIAELMGELVLNCESMAPAAPVIRSDIRVALNTSITSRNAGAGSEVLLLVDEPGGGATPLQLGVNAFRGEMHGTNSIIFRNVPVPSTSNVNSVLRVVNLRADASRLALSPSSVPSQIEAMVRASEFAIQGNTQTLAFVKPSYSFRMLNSGLAEIAGLVVPGTGAQATLEFREEFSTSFRRRNAGTLFGDPGRVLPQNVAGAIYNTETGFYAPTAAGLESGGLATQGTRLMARIAGIPAGIRVFVTVTETGSASGAEKTRLVQTDSQGAGAYAEIPSLPGALFGAGQPQAAEVPLVNGSGIAVWEVTGPVSFFSTDTLRFGVLAVPDGTASTVLTATGFLAPLSGALTSDATSPLPRFSTAPAAGGLCLSCVRVPSSIQLSTLSSTASFPVTADSNPVIFTAAASGAQWLRLEAGAGSTPSTLTVTADPTGLNPGVYTASVSVNGTTIPVTFTVYPPSTTEPVEPASLFLDVERIETKFAVGAPGVAHAVRIDGKTGLAFQAKSDTSWLLVTPSSGTLPATVTISVNTGAVAEGEYLVNVIISAPGAGTRVLPVRVSVTAKPQFLPTPAALTFQAGAGDAPSTQVLYMTSRGRQTRYTAEASSTGNWLSVTPETGTTPVNLRVTVNPLGLAPGSYTGSILMTSLDGIGPPLSVPVTLEVR